MTNPKNDSDVMGEYIKSMAISEKKLSKPKKPKRVERDFDLPSCLDYVDELAEIASIIKFANPNALVRISFKDDHNLADDYVMNVIVNPTEKDIKGTNFSYTKVDTSSAQKGKVIYLDCNLTDDELQSIKSAINFVNPDAQVSFTKDTQWRTKIAFKVILNPNS